MTSEGSVCELQPSGSVPTWMGLGRMTVLRIWLNIASLRRRATVVILGVLLSTVSGALPWRHQIKANVVCEPAQTRYLVAPFDARLSKCHVSPGEAVVPGDLLATFDGSELRSIAAGVRAKLSQAEQRELAALAGGDHSKSAIERLEVQSLAEELQLITQRQAFLELHAPIEGFIVSGDLKRAEGVQFALGEQLFEISTLDRMVAEISIPQRDVSFVRRGMKVSIAATGFPQIRYTTTIDHVRMRSEIRGGENVFIAEAQVENGSRFLRPGMQATATITVGRRPVVWLLFHRPLDEARAWMGW